MASTVGIVAVCVTLLLALVYPALARVYVLDDAAETTSRDHVTGPKRGSTKYRDTLKGQEVFESRRTSPPRSSRRVTTTTTTTTRVPTTSPQATTTTTTTTAGTTDNDYAVTTDDEASQGHEDSTTTAMTQTPDTITTIITTTNRANQQGYEVHETGDDVLDSYVRQVLGLDEHSETPRGQEKEAGDGQENYLGSSPPSTDHDDVDEVQALENSPDKALTVSNHAQQGHWQVGSVVGVRDKDNNVQALSASPNEALAATKTSYHGQKGQISVPWQGNHQVGSSTGASGHVTVQFLGRLPDEASKGRNLAQHHDHWQGDRQMVSESGSEGNDDVQGLSTSPDEALLAIPMSYQAQQGHVSITRHENHRSSSTANALQRGEVQDLGSSHDEALKSIHRSNHAQHHQDYDHWEGDRQVGSGSGAEDKDEVQILSSSPDEALVETKNSYQAHRGQDSMKWQVGSAAGAVEEDKVQHQGRLPDEFLTASQSSYRAQGDQASTYWQRNREARLVSGGEDDNNVVEVHAPSSSPQRPQFNTPHAPDDQVSTHWLRDTAVGSAAGADEEVEALGSSSDPVLTAPETPYSAQVDEVSIRWHLDPQRAAQQVDPSSSISGSTLADVNRIDANFPHYLTSSTSTTTETPLPVSYHSQQQRAAESRHFRPTMIKFTLEDRMIPPPGSYLGGGEDVLGDDGGDGGRRGRQLDLQTERTLAPEFLSIGYGGDVSQDSGLGTSRNPVKFSVDSGAAEVVHSVVVKKGRDPDLPNEGSQLNAVYGHQQLLWVTTAAPTTPVPTTRAPLPPPPAPVSHTTAAPLPARTTTTLRPPAVAVVRPEDQQFSMSSTVHGSIKFAPPSQDAAVAKSPGRLRPRQLHNVVYGSPVAAPPSSSAFVVVPARHPLQLQGPYYHHHQHQHHHGVRSQRRVPVLWASAR